MSKLEVFDPAMCCSTGVCGVNPDPALAQFASDCKWLEEHGIVVERHNLGQDPKAFAENQLVTQEMKKGMDCLPIVMLNGRIIAMGAYPSRAQLAQKLGISLSEPNEKNTQSSSCCSGKTSNKSGCCC